MTTGTQTPLDTWVKAKVGSSPTMELNRQGLAACQLQRLRTTLEYVRHRSPFYRRHFHAHDPGTLQCLDDLAQWPPTTANDLNRDPLAFLCISQSAVERVVTLPSRSPQDPARRLFFSAADLELAVDFFHRGFAAGVAPGQRMLVLMPCRTPYSTGDLLCRGLARLPAHAVAYGPMQSPRAVVDTILQERIDCLVGTPAQMLILTRYPGIDRIPGGQIKSIWLGTQNTLPAVADEISRSWGCPVFQHYGAAVMCPGGGVQCAGRNGFHLREADLFIEIVDPGTARPVPDGSYGEVIFTTLTREAMPLVRYRTGHRAAVINASCPCGSRLRRLTSVTSLPQKPRSKACERN